MQDADAGDTQTMVETLITAAEQVEAVLPDGAGVDEQAETLLEAERGGFAGLQLLLEGVGHRAELHGVELVERVFGQHRSPSSWVVA